MKWFLILSLFALLSTVEAAEKSAKTVAPKSSLPIVPMEVINDRAIVKALEDAGAKLVEDGQAVKMSTLIEQLGRARGSVKLTPPSKNRFSPTELAARGQAAVLVVASLFKCDKCPRYHSSGGSGFMLSEDGVFATAYHVVSQPKNLTLLILTGDGRVARVTEVVAASRRADVALLRAEGANFSTVSLSTNAPVGSPVWVMGHPDDHFYSLSEGIVSRYFLQATGRNRKAVTMLAVTADFAKGSSGGPVFNEYAAAVGMVVSTVSSYYTENRHGQEDLQMVFKNCIAAKHILELIQ